MLGPLIKDEIGMVGAANIFLASLLMSFAYLAHAATLAADRYSCGLECHAGAVLGINVSGNDFSQWIGMTVALQVRSGLTGRAFGFEMLTLPRRSHGDLWRLGDRLR